MKTMHIVSLLGLVLAAILPSQAAVCDVVSFGSGGSQFSMEFVTIANPGNAADATGLPNPAGAVGYVYNMGKYEVSRDMIDKANAPISSGGGNLGITLQDMTPFGGNGANRPATGISWNEAARFVNWLNTSSGFQPAYKFATQPGDVGYSANENIALWTTGDGAAFNAANPFRNSQAFYVLPTANEWYKAAYHDATAGIAGTYFNYPTGSDTAPTSVASGTAAGTAVFGRVASTGPADVMFAGGLSSYGTMGQGGNSFEWEETESDLSNNSTSSRRGVRGGDWFNGSSSLRSLDRGSAFPNDESLNLGFRVATASIPEPSPMLYGALITACGLLWKCASGARTAFRA